MGRLQYVPISHCNTTLNQVSVNIHRVPLTHTNPLTHPHTHTHTHTVEPPQVASVFSLDAMTGVLLIQAQGPGLEPSGVQNGRLEVSSKLELY